MIFYVVEDARTGKWFPADQKSRDMALDYFERYRHIAEEVDNQQENNWLNAVMVEANTASEALAKAGKTNE